MVNIVIKEEMLGFGYTENIVINIHFIKVILVREETHLQKSIFLHSQKRLQMECQLLTWSIAVVQVQELKACAKATPLLVVGGGYTFTKLNVAYWGPQILL